MELSNIISALRSSKALRIGIVLSMLLGMAGPFASGVPTAFAAASITASPTSVYPGQTVTAAWNGVTTSNNSIRLTLSSDKEGLNPLNTQPISGAAGSIGFTAPTPTTFPTKYRFRLFSGSTKVAESNEFTVNSLPLTASPTSVYVGQPVTASWSNLVPTGNDVIRMYPATALDGTTPVASQTVSTASGSVGFVAPTPATFPASYNFRLFRNGAKVATSSNFTVNASTLTASPTTRIPDQTVTATWSNFFPSGNDVIRMYKSVDTDAATPVASQTVSTASGSFGFTAPTPASYPSTYNFRLFRNGAKVATSNNFTVQSPFVTAEFSGGTAIVDSTVYAKNGAQVTLTVKTWNSNGTLANSKCVAITGAHTAVQRNDGGQSTWIFNFTAGGANVADGEKLVTAKAYSQDNGPNCADPGNASKGFLGQAEDSYFLDNTAPIITVPANIIEEATGPTGAEVSYEVTANDAQAGPITPTCNPASGSTFAIATTTVNCSANDGHGNSTTRSFTVTVRDTTGPEIDDMPLNTTVPAVNQAGATVTYTNPSAEDAVDGTRPVTCSPGSGSLFPLGQTTVTCTSTDTRGNISTSHFVIDVKDQTAPVLTLPGPITAEATGASGATVGYTATAFDNVDGSRPVNCSPASGSTFPFGTTTVTCSAADTAGNTNSGSFFVTVQDTTAPSVTVPDPITVEATGPNGAAVTFSASASDAVAGAITPTCSPASGSTFAIGEATVNCSATDTHGNTGNSSFNVTVQDTMAPVLHLPANQVLEATSPSGASASFLATATDTVDGEVYVDCNASPGTFPLGTTTVRCSAVDAHGNQAKGYFTIQVRDTTPPELTVPANMIVEATGPSGAVVSYAATAADIAVEGPIAPSCSPASGSTFALGTTTVSCTANDGHGNTTTRTFTVTVEDTTGPVLANSLTGVDAIEALGGARVNYTTPSATDVVDGPRQVTCTPISGSLFSLGTHTITCSATDSRGNIGTETYSILVQDLTAPVLAVPSDITKEATGAAGAVVSFNVSADDTVSGPVTPSCSHASGSTFPIGSTLVTCTATDSSQNTATGTFSIIVQDKTPPSVTVPTPITAEATGPTGAVVTFSASASDIVGGGMTPTCIPASGSTFGLGETTVNCSATDANGNTGSKSFTVTVQDTTAPSITGTPANMTLEATSGVGAVATYTAPTATDLVSSVVVVTCAPASGSTFQLGTTTVRCTATDGAGNLAGVQFNVTVKDTTAPVLTLPDDITEEATSAAGAAVSYEASALDIVDGAIVPSCSRASDSIFSLGETTINCTAMDEAGNTANATFKVTIVDTTPPAINGQLADLEVEAASGQGAEVSYTSPTATDLVDGTVTVTCTPISGSVLALGTHTVTCTARDSRNNIASESFTVRVQDTQKPVLSLPNGITVEATGPNGAPVSYNASANDTVDGTRPVSCMPASGATFPMGTTTVNCSATDLHNNTATDSFNVTVSDTTAPDLTVPVDKVVEATGPTGAAVTFSASAIDVVDGPVTPVCTPASGTTFGLGDRIVSCIATDSRGNSSIAKTFHVTVVDTTRPTISNTPANMTPEATGSAGAVANYTAPTATDLVSGNVAVTCSPASGSTFGLGTTTVTCTATDQAGNSASVHFDVTVRDRTAPNLTLPDDITAEAAGPSGATVSYTASALDLVDGARTPSCIPASGVTFPLGTTTVNCSATDSRSNEASGSFTITVQDRTPPAITDLSNLDAQATSGSGAMVTYSPPTVSDAVDGTVAVTCSPTSGSVFSLGIHTVTCSATDSHNNTASKTFTVRVQDTSAPVLSLPSSFTVEATGPDGAVVTYLAGANDTVDGAVPTPCTPASGATFPIGTTAVNCSATDNQSNTATGTFNVTVRDTTAPALTVPADKEVEATGPNGAVVTYTAPTATDLVDGSRTVTCNRASGSTFPVGTTTVTCSASDSRGNSDSKTFNVTVRDTTPPVVTVPADITTYATGAGGAIVTFSASANDLLDGPLTPTCSPASGSIFGPGTTVVSCSATNARGKTTTQTFNVKVAFAWSGVLQPVNPNGSSIFKLGSTIPVKFSLTGASANITNATVKLYVSKITDNVTGTEQEAVSTSVANTGNLFRYDSTSQQYVFNLGTKGLSAGTWQMRIDFGDGVTRTVNFSLRP